MIAGEASGDILGAGLIRSLRNRYPKARFVGIGGDEMIAEGFHSLVPMERLSVMGLVEVLGRIRELFRIRARLLSYFFATPPDVVIGIDSPILPLPLNGVAVKPVFHPFITSALLYGLGGRNGFLKLPNPLILCSPCCPLRPDFMRSITCPLCS